MELDQIQQEVLRVSELESEAEVRSVFSIMAVLRPQLSEDRFWELVSVAGEKDEYVLHAASLGGRVVGLMGSRVLFDLVHGKHLYIDDLVVLPESRSRGVGKKLLAFAEARARALGCASLRLSTGSENHGARRFYERERWNLRSVTYKKPLSHQ